MNPYKIRYIDYLVNNNFHFEMLSDGRIVFDEDYLKIVVNLENGIDIRIFYKMNLTDEEAEQIDVDEGIDLLFSIYEVNKGFFTKLSNKLQKKVKKPRAKTASKESKEATKKIQ